MKTMMITMALVGAAFLAGCADDPPAEAEKGSSSSMRAPDGADGASVAGGVGGKGGRGGGTDDEDSAMTGEGDESPWWDTSGEWTFPVAWSPAAPFEDPGIGQGGTDGEDGEDGASIGGGVGGKGGKGGRAE